MSLDFLQLKDFDLFYKTDLGTKVKKTIIKKITRFWSDLEENSGNSTNKNIIDNPNKRNLLGLGYTAPHLQSINSNSYSYLSVLSKEMASDFLYKTSSEYISQYDSGNDRQVISNLCHLPFEDLSIDKIIVLHSLEFSNNQAKFLRELWRILKDNGKIIFIVPNRLSIWSKIHNTPFGHGHPYSPQQLENILSNSMFTVTKCDADIFAPPLEAGFFNKILYFFYYIGQKFISLTGGMFPGGILIAEAKKEIYGLTPTGGEKIYFNDAIPTTNCISTFPENNSLENSSNNRV